VAAESQGNFVTVWSSWIAGENRAFGQRFSADNRPIGGEFPVSAATPGTQYYVSVAMTPTGES
jgi:hypothetical protein